VVEDYGHVGLTLRQHPLAFLRAELARQGIVSWGGQASSTVRTEPGQS